MSKIVPALLDRGLVEKRKDGESRFPKFHGNGCQKRLGLHIFKPLDGVGADMEGAGGPVCFLALLAMTYVDDVLGRFSCRADNHINRHARSWIFVIGRPSGSTAVEGGRDSC